MPSKALIEAIAVTVELTRGQVTRAAAAVMADDLAQYPEDQVIVALKRCRRELSRPMTIADVVARIEDGRPGPEEAWAHVFPMLGDESVSVVWTEEESQAFFACRSLEHDPVAARMAFLEAYRKAALDARTGGLPVRWSHCLGHDAAGREAVLVEAERLGRLPASVVAGLLPYRAPPAANVMALVDASRVAKTKEAA